MSSLAPRLAVYLVADPDLARVDLPLAVHQALDGGCTAVQLRAKHLTDRAMLTLARNIREMCRAYKTLFVVNDRLDIALACGADGVHLGVDDLPVADARRVSQQAGRPDLIIGYSPETDEQAAIAASEGVDYLGVGPVFGTASKPDAGEAIGLETLRRRAAKTTIPVIGIGGIETRNAASVIGAGAVGVAVVGAILRTDDPRNAARTLVETVSSAEAQRW